MSYDKIKLATHLKTLVENTSTEQPPRVEGEPQLMLGGAGSMIRLDPAHGPPIVGKVPSDAAPTLFIKLEGIRAREDFVAEYLRDDELATQVGPEAATKRLDSVLGVLFKAEQPAVDTLDFDELVKQEILKPLKAKIKDWSVRTIIKNLQVANPVRIGRVEFSNVDDGFVANTRMIMDFKGPEDPRRNTGEKALILRLLRDISVEGHSWATATVHCHESRVSELARQEIELSMNAFRAFAHILYDRDLKPVFGFPHEVAGSKAGFIGHSETGFTIQMSTRRFLSPFELNEMSLNKLKVDCYFDKVSSTVASDWKALSSLQKVIRVAVQWMGKALVALSAPEAFMNVVIALERILILDGEETTVDRFADRLTMLLENEPAERKFLHAEAKRLYDIRSRMVHQGNEDVGKEDLIQIEDLAIAATLMMCQFDDKGLQHADVRNLLHDRKLGIRETE